MKLCKSLLLSLILIFSSASFAIPSAGSVDKAELAKSRYKKELHTADTCQSIYKAIGIFIYLADEHWKKEKEEKALLYSTAAANYSTIYNTVCQD